MNIYILTEEKAKVSVLLTLLEIYKQDFHINYKVDKNVFILPLFKDNYFEFAYELIGVRVDGINKVILKTVSGSSSFMDYLFFVSDSVPMPDDEKSPLFAVEETKTSDDESRNTGVFQRCSKFVFIKPYYNNIPLYMLYNDELELREDKKPSDTSILGTNLLLTLGVKIVGKPVDQWFHKFNSVDEIISFKNGMKRPPESNIPLLLNKFNDRIEASGKLDKSQCEGKIAHDPNIGYFAIICAALRKLGWNKDIVITEHGVTQKYINTTQGRNKFLYICKLLNVKLKDISMPENAELPEEYWHYEVNSEKIASILLHYAIEDYGFKEVYQNHAGCERGYFKPPSGELITLPKRIRPEKTAPKLPIPDFIFDNEKDKSVYLIEGKKLSTINEGFADIQNYDYIERLFIKRYFPDRDIKRYLSIYGGNLTKLPDSKVLLYVNKNGLVVVNENEDVIKEVFDYCKSLKNKIN